MNIMNSKGLFVTTDNSMSNIPNEAAGWNVLITSARKNNLETPKTMFVQVAQAKGLKRKVTFIYFTSEVIHFLLLTMTLWIKKWMQIFQYLFRTHFSGVGRLGTIYSNGFFSSVNFGPSIYSLQSCGCNH